MKYCTSFSFSENVFREGTPTPTPIPTLINAISIYVRDEINNKSLQAQDKMSRVKTNASVSEIDILLERTQALMEDWKQKGNFIEAENCRITIEQMRKEREARMIRDLQRRHQDEQHQLAMHREAETKDLFQQWEARLNNESLQADRELKELQTRHIIQQQKTREQLEIQSPMKVKESPECLNLRQMLASMVKQKNYAQAHIVQKQIAELERIQKEKWMNNRGIRIEVALKHLREKQENELVNLNKNIKATLKESQKIKQREEETLALKFNNLEKDMSMKQEKEKIAHRGEFTSKGGEGSPLLTKSRLLRSRQ